MNILYIAHRIPYPPDKGDKIRSFHQIRYLSRQHNVHLACLVDTPEDLGYVQELKKYCATVQAVYQSKTVSRVKAIVSLFSRRPLSVASFWSAELHKKVRRRLETDKIDVIFAFSSTMAEYVKDVRRVPKIIDFVDVDSEKWKLYSEHQGIGTRWLYRLEARRLRRYEDEVARCFDRLLLVTDLEANSLRQRVQDDRIRVVSMGVDLDYFDPEKIKRPHDSAPAVVFTGTMDYFPNVDAVKFFCHEIFPLIRNVVPECQFYIVGRNPTRDVRELAFEPGVIVTNGVSDVRPFLAQALVAVAPLRIARGIQTKILEAMAMKLPVVGTSNAFQGLQANADDGIRIADDPKSFADEVLTFIVQPDSRGISSTQARRYVERCHRWEEHGARLEALLLETIGK